MDGGGGVKCFLGLLVPYVCSTIKKTLLLSLFLQNLKGGRGRGG